MKGIKKITVLITVFFVAVCLSGCSFSLGDKTGEVVANLTQLPAPEITQVEDGYVYWNEVPNASGYVVSINTHQESAGNSLKYAVGAVMDNFLDAGESIECHITVKARGNQILYSDSDFGEERVYTYVRSSTSNGKPTTPEITNYENNTVFWNFVSNADRYYVKINGVEYVTRDNYYAVSLPADGAFTFAVKAVSSAGESDYTEERTLDYAQNKKGETYLQTGVGYSVDVVSAKSYNDYKKGVSVLDRSKLSNASFDKNTIQYNNVKTFAANDMRDVLRKSSLTHDLKIGASGEASGISAGVELGFTSSAGFEYVDYSDKYYSVLDHYIERYSLSLVDYAMENEYIDYLSKGYKDRLARLYADQTESAFNGFFKSFGTHLIASAVFGGRLNAYFSVVTNKTKIDAAATASLSAGIKFGAEGIDASASSQSEIAKRLKVETQDIKTAFSAVAYGGNSFGASSISEFNGGYSDWCGSFNTDSANAVLINYADDGLIPLWELLPEEYSSMSDAMEQAFMKYYENGYNGILDIFAYSDTNSFAGGAGTPTDPYLISTARHMRNIEQHMDSCFKLKNDVDLSSFADWNALGGHYREKAFNGVLDGDGHAVIGMKRSSVIAEKNNRIYYGLFGYIGANGEVKNIDFKDVNVAVHGPEVNNSNTRVYFGVVAGTLYGTVENVNIVSGSFTYKICTNGVSHVGGIAGYAFGAKLKNCVNGIPFVSGRYAATVGGMVGQGGSVDFENCKNRGHLKSWCTAYGGVAYTGGMVGEVFKLYACTYQGCANEGVLSTEHYAGIGSHTRRTGEMHANEYAHEPVDPKS